jgi:hypothetical protein
MLEPGSQIGRMLVSNAPAAAEAPPIWAFCPPKFSEEPGTRIIQCNIPSMYQLSIGHGWFSSDETIREANWKEIQWALELDGRLIDLPAFGAVDVDMPQKGLPGHDPDEEIITKLRTWVINLSSLVPGDHTLKSTLVVHQLIDNGFHSTQPGVYELVVRFHVDSPPTPIPTFPPPKATLAPGETIASRPEDIAGIWKIFYTPGGGVAYIRYNLDGTWVIGASLEALTSDPPRTLLKGTYRFDGEQFTTFDTQCGMQTPGIYQFRITFEDGAPTKLNYVLIKESCRERGGDFRAGGSWAQPLP